MIDVNLFECMAEDKEIRAVVPEHDIDHCYFSAKGWYLVTGTKYWDEGFVNYLKSIKGQSVDPFVMWGSFVDWNNNLYRKRNGSNNRKINYGNTQHSWSNNDIVDLHKIKEILNLYSEIDSVTLYDPSKNINHFKETKPFHKRVSRGKELSITSKIEQTNGLFPKFHVVEFSTGKSNKGKSQDRVLNIQGNIVKVAVDAGLVVEALNLVSHPDDKIRGIYYVMSSDDFYWAIKAEDFIEGKESRRFDCKRNSTKLHPQWVSWLEEEEAIKKLVTCKRVYNPLYPPSPDLSLAQRSEFWGGSEAQIGIEALKWKNWTDQEVLNLIEKNREKVEAAYWRIYVNDELIKLRDEINNSVNKDPNLFQREWETSWRTAIDTGEAFSKKSSSFTLSPESQQAFQDLHHFMKSRNRFGRVKL